MDIARFFLMWITMSAMLIIPTLVGMALFGAAGLICGFAVGGTMAMAWVLNND